jgi:hypothetical protein
MTTPMAALSSASIKHGEFVRLTTSTQTYTFCNAAAAITVGGITFTGLGGLLSIGEVNREIRATSGDMVLTLVGIDPTNLALVLGSNIKGSTVEIWRGFFDSNNQIITSPSTQFFQRYQGVVINMSLQEDFNSEMRQRVATASVACASFREVLANRIAGVRTNAASWQALYPNDTSMSRVNAIAGQFFDFGSPPQQGSQSDPAQGPSQADIEEEMRRGAA